MTEILFKILIVGDAEVGKTSFVQRYVNDSFRKGYKPTLGVDFALKVIPWSETETVRLQLWDIAGQERFTSMTRVYYKRASACVIMFDITQPQSFHSTVKWKRDLDSKCFLPNGNPIPCILVANKIDLPGPRGVEKDEINTFCKQHSFLGWTEMSVKEGKHVPETMNFLVEELMLHALNEESSDPPKELGTYIGLEDDYSSDKRRCCSSSCSSSELGS